MARLNAGGQRRAPSRHATRAFTAGRGSGKLSPEAVADAVVRAIESGRAETCIGKIHLLKWLLRLAPGVAYRMLKDG